MRFEQTVVTEDIRVALKDVVSGKPVVQTFGEANEYIIQLEQSDEGLEGLSARVQEALVEEVLPRLGISREQSNQALNHLWQ